MEEQDRKGISWGLALLIALLVCLMGLGIARLLTRPKNSQLLSATLLPCTAAQDVAVLGKGVVYSDGTTLRALNANGRQIWSYVVGANCGFSPGTNSVVAWSNDLLVVLDASSGNVTFSVSLAQPILSAVVGQQYTAALVGEEGDGTIIILEKAGREIDRVAQSDITVLDYGFFNNGNMLYVSALDTNGTVPMSQITTFRPGRMQAGSITDSEQVIYEVLFESNDIEAVGTTYLRVYDYTGSEQAAKRRLVYGWYLMSMDNSSGSPMMAFVPMSEVGANTMVNDIRMICGDIDRTVRMPFTCFDLTARNTSVYGVSNDYVMIYDLDAVKARTYQLPVRCDGLIGITSSGTLVIVSGNSVYMVPM